MFKLVILFFKFVRKKRKHRGMWFSSFEVKLENLMDVLQRMNEQIRIQQRVTAINLEKVFQNSLTSFKNVDLHFWHHNNYICALCFCQVSFLERSARSGGGCTGRPPSCSFPRPGAKRYVCAFNFYFSPYIYCIVSYFCLIM